MTAYYNEHDAFAAAWLRNLIAAGAVAPGDVDERDIRDVRPGDLAGYAQCHFFAGIGVWSLALRMAGWPDDRAVWTGSCPCQPFSAAGRRYGFADERHLWPHWQHLIWQCRPAVILGEQVASKDGLPWIELVHADLEGTGYAVGAAITPVAGFGAPHGRHRLWFVADAIGARAGRHAGSAPGAQGGSGGARGADGRDSGNAPVADGAVGILADTAPGRREQGHGSLGSGAGAGFRSANHLGLGDAIGAGLEILGEQHARGELAAVERTSTVGIVGNASRGRQREQRHAVVAQQGRHADSAGDASGGLGDAHGQREAKERDFPDGSRAIATRGAWACAEWLPCRDGKWRPVEPGTFPLAHGLAGRVGRLRAYGNAISPWPAAEFIAAYLEARGEQAVTLLDMLE